MAHFPLQEGAPLLECLKQNHRAIRFAPLN